MEIINLVILFSGNGSNMENLVHKLHDKEFASLSFPDKKYLLQVSACITNNPLAYGIKRCENLGIKCEIMSHKDFNKREDFDNSLCKLVLTYQPKLCILAGFMRILSDKFTSYINAINIHPSLLPKFKGANAIEESYYSQEINGGVSVHYVNEFLDGGEIILQESIKKIKNESLSDFEERIHHLEYEIYPKAILKVLKLKEA